MSDRYVKDNSQLSNLSHQVESGGWAVLSELGNCRGEADWAGKLQLLFWIRWIRWACEPSPNMLILSVWMQQSLLSQEKLRFMIQDIRRPDPTEVPFLAGSPLEWGSLSLLLVFLTSRMDEQADLSESFGKFQQHPHLRLSGLHWARSEDKLHLDWRKGLVEF